MRRAQRLALGAVVCLTGAAILACGTEAIVIQAILPEAPVTPGPPPPGKGVLAIQNNAERLSVTCLLIRRHNSDTTVANPAFLVAVAVGAAGTVLLATRLGLPVSTTHALIGGLVGAGLALAPAELAWSSLTDRLLLPLLLSPLLPYHDVILPVDYR